jgi:hypothetical protein
MPVPSCLPLLQSFYKKARVEYHPLGVVSGCAWALWSICLQGCSAGFPVAAAPVTAGAAGMQLRSPHARRRQAATHHLHSCLAQH